MPIPSKILLFGEHTVIKGSQALAMPLDLYSGEWLFGENRELQRDLLPFSDYLSAQHLPISIHIKHFKRDLEKGIYFQADIPEGYGVGSSGAVCAAILARYGKVTKEEKANIPLLKAQFSLMEGFFHGKSSGIDPLVSFLKKPIHLISPTEINAVTIPKKTRQLFFLLDTGIKRSAERYIQWFQAQNEQKAFAEAVQNELIPQNNAAIQHTLCGNVDNLCKTMHEISTFQFKNMAYMIPEKIHPIWKKGLATGTFSLKICGAGGGGFMLGVGDWEVGIRDWEIRKFVVSIAPN
jgi:mevalonate kinase